MCPLEHSILYVVKQLVSGHVEQLHVTCHPTGARQLQDKFVIYICLFHTHMVYCYIMTNIIMNTHNNNNKRYNKILKSADSISR